MEALLEKKDPEQKPLNQHPVQDSTRNTMQETSTDKKQFFSNESKSPSHSPTVVILNLDRHSAAGDSEDNRFYLNGSTLDNQEEEEEVWVGGPYSGIDHTALEKYTESHTHHSFKNNFGREAI